MARFLNFPEEEETVCATDYQEQPIVDRVTGNKIPKSFVFCRGKLPGPLMQLEMDLRKLMLPDTALKLKVKVSSCRRIVFLNYNKDTKLIDFLHYSIRLQPVGVSRRIRKFLQNHQVPDLRNLKDVSNFVTKAGFGSESEMDEAATVSLPVDLDRVNRASNKSAVKLQEIGPRMTLQLMKIEEGLCTGGVIFSEFDEQQHEESIEDDDDEEEDDNDNDEIT